MALPDLTDQFIADAYKGVLHTSNIPVTETTLPQVYDGLGNKTSLRLGKDGDGASINGCLTATCIVIGGSSLLDFIYPVGSVHISTDNNNPSTRFAGTSWEQIAKGKFLAGEGAGTDKNAESIGIVAGDDSTVGEYRHTLTVGEMPNHSHSFPYYGDSSTPGPQIQAGVGSYLGDSGTSPSGSSQPHNNIPPYFGLYIWKRIA